MLCERHWYPQLHVAKFCGMWQKAESTIDMYSASWQIAVIMLGGLVCSDSFVPQGSGSDFPWSKIMIMVQILAKTRSISRCVTAD